jgi:hypothetical protein
MLNRVLKLTRTEFAERTEGVIEPDSSDPYPAGLHTICRLGDITLVDGKRFRFISEGPLNAGLARRIRDVRESLIYRLTGRN